MWVSCIWEHYLQKKLRFETSNGKSVKCGQDCEEKSERQALPEGIYKIDVHVSSRAIRQIDFYGDFALVVGRAFGDETIETTLI